VRQWIVLCGGAQGELEAAGVGLAPVARFVRDDLQQPRPKREIVAKAVERVVRLDEAVLSDLFGIGRRAGQQERRAKSNALVARDDLLVRVWIALACALDQRRIFQYSALRVCSSTPDTTLMAGGFRGSAAFSYRICR
jgi:hypothetical protein